MLHFIFELKLEINKSLRPLHSNAKGDFKLTEQYMLNYQRLMHLGVTNVLQYLRQHSTNKNPTAIPYIHGKRPKVE